MIMALEEDSNNCDDIGIIGMDVYFPRYYVDQNELGKHSFHLVVFDLIIN